MTRAASLSADPQFLSVSNVEGDAAVAGSYTAMGEQLLGSPSRVPSPAPNIATYLPPGASYSVSFSPVREKEKES